MDSLKVCVTGACGQIAYSLLPLICSGQMFGHKQSVTLHLLDIPPLMGKLEGVVMELEDCAYPLLRGVVATAEPEVAFDGVDVAILVGAFPRQKGMERKDLLAKNCGIFEVQGKAINKVASRNVKVLVVGNPANTNCLICQHFAPDIPKENFSALTRLDHNRARSQLANKLKIPVSRVHQSYIWGNHSSTQYPDVSNAFALYDGEKKNIMDLIDNNWLQTEFIETVQQRGAAVIKARELSSALSAANAICDHVRDWLYGTVKGEVVSMAVLSDGSYNVPEGLMYSFPVRCIGGGRYEIVQGLPVSEFSRGKMELTAKELQEEKDAAFSLLK